MPRLVARTRPVHLEKTSRGEAWVDPDEIVAVMVESVNITILLRGGHRVLAYADCPGAKSILEALEGAQ